METGKEWGDVEQQHKPTGGHQSKETSEKLETSEELEEQEEEEGLSWGCGFDMNLSVQPVVVSSVLVHFSTESKIRHEDFLRSFVLCLYVRHAHRTPPGF